MQGGNSRCQQEFGALARESDPEGRFFTHMRDVLVECQEWIIETQKQSARGGDDVKAPSSDNQCNKVHLLVITFIQLLCEGHNLEMQNILRDQSFNRISRNLIFHCSTCLRLIAPSTDVYRYVPAAQREVLLLVLVFLIEVCQGPCPENQAEIGANENLGACQILLAASVTNLDNRDVVLDVKSKTISLLAALYENCGPHAAIMQGTLLKIDIATFDKVYEEFHYALHRMDMKKASLLKQAKPNPGFSFEKGKKAPVALEELEEFDVQIRGLTDSICNIMAIRKKLSSFSRSALERMGSDTIHDLTKVEENMPSCHRTFSQGLGSVEVFWNGKTEDIIFPRPQEAKFLSDTTKTAFVNECDLSSSDTRVKYLMRNRYTFLDEMEVLAQFNQFFQVMLRNYFMLKKLLFVLILLLNFNMVLTLSQGSVLWEKYYGTDMSC